MLTNVSNIIIVSSVTIRKILIFYDGINHEVEIDIDVPFDEISLNAYEQLNSENKLKDDGDVK